MTTKPEIANESGSCEMTGNAEIWDRLEAADEAD